jgi:predicted dehydrogenase
MNTLKVAIIGFGHLGRWHAQKAIAFQGEENVIIVEATEAGRQRAKDAHANVKIVSDINEVINEIDAGFIVTPTSFHFEVAKQLLNASKHVFCEKPVTSTSKEAYELKEIAASKNIIFQVGHSERFHQAWDMQEEYKEFLEGKAHIELKRVAPFKGRATDVDVVQDLMIHDLDLLLYLFKERPTSVTSTGFKIRTKLWDYVSSRFTFASGRFAQITVGRNNTEEIRSLDIVSEKGSMTVDLFRSCIKIAKGSAQDETTFVTEKAYEKRDHLYLEHECFYKSINTNSEAVITLDDGIKAVELIDKVLESLEGNKTIQL